MDKSIEFAVGCVVILIVSIAMSVVMPLLYAMGGYFTGWILSSVFVFAGQWVVSGASNLGLEIPLSSLPFLGAFLAFVGSFFRSHQTNTNKAK